MPSRIKYRLLSAGGTAVLTAIALTLANLPVVQWFFTSVVPVMRRLQPNVHPQAELVPMLVLVAGVFLVSLGPLFKPRPRRILDIVFRAEKRVFSGGLVLATLGYFDYTYKLPRATLIMTVGILAIVMPAWFIAIRHRPTVGDERAILIGDDLDQMREIVVASDHRIIGYVSSIDIARDTPERAIADGGWINPQYLGGLSRLDDIFVAHNVDTAIFAFTEPNRAEFFGALAECHEHGVAAKVHRDHADSVLTSDIGSSTLVDVDVEPLDWQDRAVKRVFDFTFATVGLVSLLPVMAAIAVAIKLDSRGPVFYSQERTAEFGETFQVYKIRTMLPDSEDFAPVNDDENDRITRVGRVLRRTHLDEIPQLWSILLGKMSVVGPRAAWTDEEVLLESEAGDWRKRWFVKPGLTGLAQINGVTSTEPRQKLRYDVEYIRRQSFSFDIAIVIRQLWLVGQDILSSLR